LAYPPTLFYPPTKALGSLSPMDGSRRTIGLLVAATLLWSGCASPSHRDQSTTDTPTDPVAKAATEPSQGLTPAGSPAVNPSAPSQPAPLPSAGANASSTLNAATGPDSRDFGNVIAELQTLGALDPAARDRLMDDLKRTDPALWPQMMQYYRAALAYQRRTAGQSPDPSRSEGQSPAPSVADLRSPAPGQRPARANEPAAAPNADPQSLAAAASPIPATTSDSTNASKSAGTEAIPPESQRASAPSGASADRVVPASYDRPVPGGDWQGRLNAAILALETETAQPPKTAAETARHVQLRFLYLAAGRRDDALRPIQGLPAPEQDFWSKEIYGLAGYLDAERVPDAAKRATEAMLPLGEARAKLGELSALAVRNLAFCTEVVSYGVYTRFEKNEFKPGQEVLLYAELDHFKSEETRKGFHTALKSSYQILDSRGQRVTEQEFPTTEEYCQNPRRDFFIRYFLWMPKRIYDGKYTLQLTIEDTKSRKVGQSSVEFTIREK
jgi:hypothetical protein